ncbi:MAG: bifunctional DNA-formamidopyrimidine glycosylase/DNA-(apurinic or apyrimidinic site) lyase [Candidatus Margulisbacteria bacterium]|jgi:formamidopyrimidine-DNA glycosylase|nr:bifunctional DNA-formamidopyrimidine glycosylase/DNA-(apurinic or apyrimidinic site) lyase [Candidatus Margulisiibacteriota bacterium]
MPELPEVETVRRGLQRTIVGRTIASFDCDTRKMLNQPLPFYRQTLPGLKVVSVDRRAKMLIIKLTGGWNILAHLKMTGQLVFCGDRCSVVGGHPIKAGYEQDPNRFTHGTFTFRDKSRLYFNDVRKFGWLRLFSDADLSKQLDHDLGPEPLDHNFTLDVFRRELGKRPNNRIKQFLMDNKNVVGIGNIYSDEICYFARVRPDRRVKNLKDGEIALLFRGIKNILTEAIKYEGTSISDYVNAAGEAGAYTKFLKVYGRYGEQCFKCKGTIKRQKIGGRTSSFCLGCQK